MEKSTKNFIDDAPYWQVILITFIIITSITYGGFSLIIHNATNHINDIILLRTYSTLGFGVFGTLFVLLTVLNLRNNKKFWNKATEVEQKLRKANSKSALKSLLEYEFDELMELSSGGTIHNQEIKRLYSMLDIKISTYEN
jgi:hypothetical protein